MGKRKNESLIITWCRETKGWVHGATGEINMKKRVFTSWHRLSRNKMKNSAAISVLIALGEGQREKGEGKLE